ncbi:MAG: Alkyl hydroperoxide reductase AhpD [Rubritepida sp.]|nr:Alkyl hydroperoxide reductase AhpD [Rubritepida sp.]
MTEHKPRDEATSFLRITEPQKVTPELAELQDEEKARKGYVRHGLTLPFRPEHLVASQRFVNLLVRGPNGLLPFRERELLALVVSVENRCDVCTIQHATA